MLIEQIEKEVSLESTAEAKVDLLNKFAFQKRNEDPKLSLELSEKALHLSTAHHYKKGRADSLLNIGFSKMHSANHEGAYISLFEALELFIELNDHVGIANTQYNIGIVHVRSGNFDSAIEVLHKCLSYREKINDKNGIAAAYFQLTYIHQHFNDLDSAYEAGIKSLEIRKEMDDPLGLAATLMVLGEVYMKRKELDKAKEVLSESLRLRRTSPEKMGYFATLLRWAELHSELKDYEKAMAFSTEGLTIAKGEGVNFGVIKFLQMLGKVNFTLNNIPAAKEHYLSALEYAQKYSFRSMLFEIHQSLAEIYEKEQNFEKAYYHFRLYNNTKEEVISLQSNGRLKSVQFVAKIEFAQKEAEAEKVRNAELNKAYHIIEEKNKEITDSINYAKRIQSGIIPSENELKKNLGDHFVLYKPKDIVSGDFYWCVGISTNSGKKLSIAAAVDCTGHGVPGAFMSMLGNTLLNQTIKNPLVNSPADVLNFLNHELPKNLKSYSEDVTIRDGMDMSLCAIDFEDQKLYFAGANNPCWIIRKGEVIELKADKQAISASTDQEKIPFTNNEMDLLKGDTIYLFTDGFADQFGGPKGKKFKYNQFKELLVGSQSQSMRDQKNLLNQTFEEWRGECEQVDDVLVIGIRI